MTKFIVVVTFELPVLIIFSLESTILPSFALVYSDDDDGAMNET